MGKIICFKYSIKNIKKPIPIIEMGFFYRNVGSV